MKSLWDDIQNEVQTISEEEHSHGGPSRSRVIVQRFLGACLRTATKRSLLNVVKRLIEEESVDPDYKDEGTTPIMIAARQGDVAIVEYFLSLTGKVDINAQNSQGMTSLMIACSEGFVEVVNTLLENPLIDVNAADKDGFTALLIACSRGHEDIVSLLLGHEDIEVNKPNSRLMTALMIAANMSHAGVVRLLLTRDDIKVNAQSASKFTALMCACDNDNTEIVSSLLQHQDIDINLEDSNNESALVWACDNNQTEAISLLLGREELRRTHSNIVRIMWFVMRRHVDMNDMRLVIEEAVTKNLPDIARWLLQIEGYLLKSCSTPALLRSRARSRARVRKTPYLRGGDS